MKSIRPYLFFLLILSSSAFLFSQDFQFTAFSDYYGGIESSDGYQHLRSRIFMQPVFNGYEDSSGLEWYFSARLWVQPLGDRTVIDNQDILQEAYILYPSDYFDLSFGQKLVTYGFADLFGPLNVMHSTFRAPFSIDDSYESRRPDPLVQLQIYPNFEDIIEICYVPVTRTDEESIVPVVFDETGGGVDWNENDWILDSLHSVTANYRHFGEKFDLQFLYGWYVEQTPDFKLDADSLNSGNDILPVYNRKQTLGGAYSTRLGSSTFSQDVAFNLTKNFDGSDPGAQLSDITVNTQWLVNLPWGILSQYSLVYSYFFNYNKAADTAYPISAISEEIRSFHNQPLQHIAFAVGHFEKSFLREKLKTQLNVVYIHPNVMLTPRAAFSFTDYWSFETGADYTTGKPSDKDFRRNPYNDNFYVRLIFRY